jgi:hypothetical protein
MEKAKRRRLGLSEALQDFLELSDEETALVAVKVDLVDVTSRGADARDPSLRSG